MLTGYTFVLSPDGRTGTENASGTDYIYRAGRDRRLLVQRERFVPEDQQLTATSTIEGPGRVIVPGLFIFARNVRAPDPKHRVPSQRRGGGDESPPAHGDCQGCSDGDDDRAVVHAVAGTGGAAERESLRLDAHIVSRNHGAFLFSNHGLQFIDYGSANGSYVDGVRVAPNRPIDVRNSSVITIVPFQIVAHIDLVNRGGCRTTRTLLRQRSCPTRPRPRLRLRGRWRAFATTARRCAAGAPRAGPTSSGGAPGTS